MKKTLSIIALSVIAFGLTSCKKETKTEETTNETVVADSTAAPAAIPDSTTTTTTTETTTATQTVGAETTATSAAKSGQPLTTIALAQSSYDFGNIKKGSKASHVYEITNTGKNPLIISEVKPGCGCTAPEFTKEPIMPGKKGKITLSFDSSNFDGAVSKYADVFANVEKAPIKLTFVANVQP
ncbi:hypothetical protein ASG01_08125 [Chryseobacterium sp. Leaf180]|uniref:DUF1573 domain-containing protein n=1 Tax=Chryseobacterium sp. Leaf180 TaxID=1736289 RepID=UPI0006F3B5BD|nr:DUF1573 domain-containing protein [Chryseobacterium sp. Leaf180]KQR93819.1 hypothetical protein ASG01_08125 [Chryseobacterium sp. Leaf180]